MKQLVVIGTGMSAMKVVDELLNIDPLKYQITMIGGEKGLPYNRIMLSPVLAGEKSFTDIITHNAEYFAQNNITFNDNTWVNEIDRGAKKITTTHRETKEQHTLHYDKLVLCTGSNPFILPLPGKELSGVLSFRDIYDVDKMKNMYQKGKKVAVIGAGLLGLEAANGLNEIGYDVLVINNNSSIMDMQLDSKSGDLLQKELEKKGIKFKLSANTKAILGETFVNAVEFADGEIIKADMVVMSVGIRPNDTLAKTIGLECDNGIKVNDVMMTSDPSIYSVGECIKHRGATYGLVAPLYEQARVCAEQLAEKSVHYYSGSNLATRLKISGVDVFSAGDFKNNDDEVLCSYDNTQNKRKRLSIRDNKLVGAVLFGDSKDGLFYEKLINDEVDITDMRDTLLFGDISIDTSSAGQSGVEAMADDEQVCGCMGVTKGDIITAISNGCESFEAVQEQTGCGTGCGGCSSLAQQIFEFSSGTQVQQKETLCSCTDKSSEEVRLYVRSLTAVQSVDEVRNALGFKSSCESCGQAINYYLYSQFNEKYQHSSEDRPHNEMMHANLQNDGTYSIVPQMAAGLTTPDELKALADIAVKYEVPTVKLTGGQRVDLLGITKENLKPIWDEIAGAGMRSGFAYGKATRTCKSCVGSEHCLMGTQDSMGLAEKMEQAMWSIFMPHKFKMGVSGCPRNCAEATIKDFGIICTEKGYEVHVAGACGIRTKPCLKDRFFEKEADVVEYLKAFVQLYRMEANYLERVMHFEERVGLDYISEQLNSPEKIKYWADKFPINEVNPWEVVNHNDGVLI
jgi:nitrite reductase (NADH) large subunit